MNVITDTVETSFLRWRHIVRWRLAGATKMLSWRAESTMQSRVLLSIVDILGTSAAAHKRPTLQKDAQYSTSDHEVKFGLRR